MNTQNNEFILTNPDVRIGDILLFGHRSDPLYQDDYIVFGDYLIYEISIVIKVSQEQISVSNWLTTSLYKIWVRNRAGRFANNTYEFEFSGLKLHKLTNKRIWLYSEISCS